MSAAGGGSSGAGPSSGGEGPGTSGGGRGGGGSGGQREPDPLAEPLAEQPSSSGRAVAARGVVEKVGAGGAAASREAVLSGAEAASVREVAEDADGVEEGAESGVLNAADGEPMLLLRLEEGSSGEGPAEPGQSDPS